MPSDEPISDHSHSVTLMIERLRHENPEAAAKTWRRYFERLLTLARSKLAALPHRAVDEEDVLVSVFDRFFQAAKQDRFVRLRDRDDLWQILLMLTERKVANQYRSATTQKRGGAIDQQAPVLHMADFNEPAAQEPAPEFVAIFNDHLARALERLGEPLTREVALLRMEGYDILEIAPDFRVGNRADSLKVIHRISHQGEAARRCYSISMR